MKYCTFTGEGVQLGTIATPQAEDAAKRFGFGGGKAHGYIDGRSGKHPRGQQHFGNGEGALEFITCEVDRGGKDNNMQCLDLGVRNVRLTLASTQDIAADRWQRPAAPEIPTALVTFSQGKTIDVAQHAVQFSGFTKMVPESRKAQVKTIEKRKTQDVSRLRSPLFRNIPVKQMDIIKKRQETNLIKRKPL